jgi:predicted Zn-dependent protease
MISFSQLEKYFEQLSDFAFSQLQRGEHLGLNLAGEEQDYVRFSQAKVRQNTSVTQLDVEMIFQSKGRKTSSTTSLLGHEKEDQARLAALLERARQEVEVLPPDPYLVPMMNHGSSRSQHHGRLLSAGDAVKDIAQTAAGSDFAGLYAGGPMIRANKNSLGQSHWFSTESFFVDYSLFAVNSNQENKAVKGVYSDSQWSTAELAKHLQNSKNQLALLQKPTVTVKPGSYRTFFAPGAMAEISSMMSWGALSFSAMKRGTCALTKLYNGEVRLSEKFTFKENFRTGLSPRFNALGEVAPDELTLIKNGKLENMLVSSRSARQYGATANGAGEGEAPRSPEIATGTLAEAHALRELGTGLSLSHLHYLNWSDISAARITGMTRYACFWVENGEIVGPIKDLRFDDSLFRIFGSELIDLTSESVVDPAVSTYDARALGGKKLPGALLGSLTFTL